MPNLFARALDGSDRSVEAHDVLAGLALLALALFQAFALWRGQVFNTSDFGMSCAAILAAGAGVAAGQGYLIGRARFRGNSQVPDDPDGGRP